MGCYASAGRGGAPLRVLVSIVVAAAACSLASPAAAQSTAQYAALALAPGGGEPPVACGTPAIFARQVLSGFAPPGSIRRVDADAPDVQPLWFDQNPRLLHAEHAGGLALDNLLVLGDVETLSFERFSASAEENVVEETWQRTRTTSIDGYLISVFDPTWNDAELWDTIGVRRRGFDLPYVYFGSVTVPSTDDDDDDDGDDDDDDETFHIRLSWAPRNVPSAQVTRIDDKTQYASHVVNLVISDFGNARLSGGSLDLAGAAEQFYEHFRDEYDSIAFVSRQLQLVSYGAFHRNVRNPIGGLGALSVFDNTPFYGSASVLRSVEFYPSARFGVTSTSTHEIAHQWLDYWDWSALGDGVERAGHQPEAHTPLLYPGEVYAGAVLSVARRVAAGDDGASYAIEGTPAPALLHPTTKYRMGLIEASAVPDLVVFENQGQFDEETSSSPDVGTAVEGGVKNVHINDIMTEHGVRTGPVDGTWSRVTVVVSRDGLLSADEMSYWNLLAARHAATEGVTSWAGVPSFFEATGGAVPLRTDVTPSTHAKIDADLEVSHLSIDPGEFRGVRLDASVPASIDPGDTVTLAGTVTATDRDDFTSACVRWSRYGVAAEDRIFECARISGDRFSVPYTFSDAEAGHYAVQMFLFFPDAGTQYPRSNVSGISVVGDPPQSGPHAVGSTSATQAIVVTVRSGGRAGEACAVGMQLGPGDYCAVDIPGVDLGTDWFAVTSDGLGCLSFICTRSALTLNGFEARPIAGTDNWQIHAVP